MSAAEGEEKARRKHKLKDSSHRRPHAEKNVERRGHRRTVERSASLNCLFGSALVTFMDYDLISAEVSRKWMQQYERYEAMTFRKCYDNAVKEDVRENWVVWLCFQNEVMMEVDKNFKAWKVSNAAGVNNLSGKGGAELQRGRTMLRTSVRKNLLKFQRKFSTDRRVDFTILDLMLRFGMTSAFDANVSALLVMYPNDAAYWYLAIRRRIAAGDFLTALSLCQKALRHHSNDEQLLRCVKNLTLIVAATTKAAAAAGDLESGAAIAGIDDAGFDTASDSE